MTLITGHKGFIGSHLVENKLDYIGYDLKDGQDIRNKYQLAKIFANNNIKTVIHLAAEAGVRRGEKYSDEYISTNINGTRNLLELAEEYNVKHFIFFSSSSVYGEQKPPLKEDMRLQPTSLYGTTKLTGELLCRISPVPITIIRPFSVYGENGRGDQVLYKWIHQLEAKEPVSFYGDGSTIRGYIYVKDLILGLAYIISRKEDVEFEVFNLGGQEKITLNDLYKLFKERYPWMEKNIIPLPKVDVKANWADISKAKKQLKWSPHTNFNKKIKELLWKM